MENVVADLISQWGSFGILVTFALYIVGKKIVDFVSGDKDDNKLCNDANFIIKQMDSFRDDLKYSIASVETRIDSLRSNFNSKHEIINHRLDELDEKVKNQPSIIMNNLDMHNSKLMDMHNKKLMSQIELGPKLHNILSKYLEAVGCDHIILAAFHNGTATLSGIPYCKFDIISEKFHLNEKDTDFAPLYKNVDILLHGKLPSIMIQNEYMHFDISNDKNKCILDDIDDILYRRLLGRDIKQLDLHILRDKYNIPIGFIGCIKYDNEKMKSIEIDKCVYEIENIYNDQLEKIKE